MKNKFILFGAILLFSLMIMGVGSATTTTFSNPTIVNDFSVGDTNWTNPENAGASDNSYATITTGAPWGSSYLKATNWGINIPENSVINGILVEIEQKRSSSVAVKQNHTYLMYSNGTISKINKATTDAFLATTDTYVSYGNLTDLWNLTWTSGDVNNANFGVVYEIYGGNSGTGTWAYVDNIRLTLNYTTYPTYYDKYVDSFFSGIPAEFGITINDDILHPNGMYIFSTNNTGTWINTTLTNFTSTPQTITNITTLNSTTGVIVGYRWFFNDSDGNTNSTPIYTLTTSFFNNTGESYSTSTHETQNETFYLNITTLAGLKGVGAFLVYNGSNYSAEYTCSGNTCQIWKNIDIPLMTTTNPTENKSFYWRVTVYGDFGTSTVSTATHNQNVSNLMFSNDGCVGGYNNSVNFTIYNETDRALINAGFKSVFYYWLGGGTVKDKYNYTGYGHNNYLFCINHNESYITSSDISLNTSNDNRYYQFSNEIYTNVLKTQKLYISDDSLASSIIIEVKNQGLVPLAGITVNISRFYPGTNEYEVVENQVTDEFGQINARLIKNDVKYRFDFFDASGNLLYTSGKVTVICRSSICVIPFVIETTTDYLEQYDNLTLFSSGGITFNNVTNTFIYAWSDQRGESVTYRLEVVRYAFNESTVVCNVTSTQTVSSLSCAVGDTMSSYTAQAFRQVNGKTEIRMDNLQEMVGDISATFGIEGLFWVFILLMICISMGAYNPTVGAVLYGAGFIILGMIHLIYMPTPVFFANTILVVLFIWAIKI